MKVLGRSFRRGIPLIAPLKVFPDEASVETWFKAFA